MSEQRSRIQDRERLRENHQVDEGRNNAPKPLGGRICSVLGILFGVGGILAALMGISVDIAAGVIGAALGVLGFPWAPDGSPRSWRSCSASLRSSSRRPPVRASSPE